MRHYKLSFDNTFHVGTGNLKVLAGWQLNRRQEFEDTAFEPGLDFRLNTLNYDIRWQGGLTEKWKAAFGIAGMGQKSENLGEEYLIPAYTLLDAGIFGTASRTLGEWTLSGGIRTDIRLLDSDALQGRFESFSKRFPGVSASIGAIRPMGRHFTLKANLSRGFRAPNLAELGSNGEHEGTFRFEVGNTNLAPEYSLQADLGVDYSASLVSIQAAAFASRIDNYIFAARNGSISDEGLPVYVFQSGLAHLKGGEFGIDFHPVHQLHLSSAFSCVYARGAGGDDLPLIPSPRLFSEVKWELSHGGSVLNNTFIGPYKYPFNAAATPKIPSNAVAQINTISHTTRMLVSIGPAFAIAIIGCTFSNSIAGVNANIYGTMNAPIASFVALKAVFMGGAFAIAEPA